MVKFTGSIAAVAGFLSLASAHPGHDGTAEMQERNAYMATLHTRDLSHCAATLKKRGHTDKIAARRQQMADKLRKERGLDSEHYLRARDFNTVLASDHHSNRSYVGPWTADSVVFGPTRDAILSPEVTEGPYYVSGELIRSDVMENQAGVELVLDMQVIDYNTCEPLPNIAIDFWHCNATGVYGGIEGGFGNGNSADLANINNTMLRGVQMTDKSGVATFKSIVPGHYTGRTNHIHIMSHLNSTVLPNNTVTGGTVAHVGQFFFDQSLLTQIEATAPYSSNTQQLTTNAEDMIMSQASEGDDPIVEYVMLGKTVSDGIFAWINVGVDSTHASNVSAASIYSSNGGRKNPNAMMGPPGGFPGNGSFPSGFPSGFPGFPGSSRSSNAASTAATGA